MSSITCLFTLPNILLSALFIFLIDHLLPYLRPCTLSRYLHRSKDGNKPAWALITGASDGIGLALAHELASFGFNIVLHGRNSAKLTSVQTTLTTLFPHLSFLPLIADSTHLTSPSTLTSIAHRLSDIHLTVLVNNAGGTPITTGNTFKPLSSYTHQEITNTINLNAAWPTMLWNALLPQLERNSPALIIAVGSLSSNGLPLIAPYGAAKSYLKVLCEAVQREMEMARRDVEVLHVGLATVTGVQNVRVKESLFVPRARTMAKAILRRVGCGRVDIVPYLPHALQSLGSGLMPRTVQGMVFKKIMADMRDNGLGAEEEKRD